MQQFLGFWDRLAPQRRALLVGSLVAVLAGLALLYSFAARSSMSLLYAGLEGAAAGGVLSALDQQGALYEVRGTAIYVETARRDELRMALAAEGLPDSGSAGYELLDTLSGFGTTAQMFDAAYWRAKEGELARTLTTGLGLRAARVHIASAAGDGLRAPARASASVTVTPRAAALSDRQAKALRYLVASAVPGMVPGDVAVIDATSGLLLGGGDRSGEGDADDRAETLRKNAERLLEARVGAGNAVVELSVDTVSERESITERRFDPQSRVAISTDTEEKSTTARNGDGGAVTVASNLPDQGKGMGESSQSQSNETRERTNFEVSETQREVLRVPGGVRRLSVAVMVNGTPVTAPDGQVRIEPRDDAELAALRDLVSSAVGLDTTRGDVITIKSFPFEPVAARGSDAAAPGLLDRIDLMTVIRIGAAALVTLILGLFVLRPLLRSRPLPVALPAPAHPATAPAVLNGVIEEGEFLPGSLAIVPASHGQARLDEPRPGDAVARLRGVIAERQDETAEVLRGWLGAPAERGAE